MCIDSPGNPQRDAGGEEGKDKEGEREREYIRNELYGESTYPTILLSSVCTIKPQMFIVFIPMFKYSC